MCQGRESGDEFHYLFECTEFVQERVRLISQKYRCSPNTVTYCALMCSNYVVQLSKLCKFIRIVNSKVCPYVGRRVWRNQRGNQNPFIEEEQTRQWPQTSTKGQTTIYKTYKQNQRSSNTNPTRNQG